MDGARKGSFTTGTVDFRYDVHDDIVFAKARWTLETPAEVMRWYDMHSRYLTARFKRPKDLIIDEDHLIVAPRVAGLFERYMDRLHETLVRYSAVVSSRPRLRLAVDSSEARGHTSVETATLVDGVAAIHGMRDSDSRTVESSRVPSGRPTISGVQACVAEHELKAAR